MSTPTPPEMVDLEARLRTDESGEVRDQVCQMLDEEIRGVKRRMDTGLSPEEFAAASAVRSALEAATTVVKLAWQANRR